MAHRTTLIAITVITASTAFLVGCASSRQVISVETVPTGAEVYLQRRGMLSIEATVSGVSGAVDGGQFEDEFILTTSVTLSRTVRLLSCDVAALS